MNIKASIALLATLFYTAEFICIASLCTLHNWSKVWNAPFNLEKDIVMTIFNHRKYHPLLFLNNAYFSETDTQKNLRLLFRYCTIFLGKLQYYFYTRK